MGGIDMCNGKYEELTKLVKKCKTNRGKIPEKLLQTKYRYYIYKLVLANCLCKNVILVAEAGGNPDFPEIFTYWKCPDGTQIDLVASGADLPKQEDGSHGDGIHTYKRLYSFLLTWVLFIYSTI